MWESYTLEAVMSLRSTYCGLSLRLPESFPSAMMPSQLVGQTSAASSLVMESNCTKQAYSPSPWTLSTGCICQAGLVALFFLSHTEKRCMGTARSRRFVAPELGLGVLIRVDRTSFSRYGSCSLSDVSAQPQVLSRPSVGFVTRFGLADRQQAAKSCRRQRILKNWTN